MRPLIIAHRGNSAHAPENTVAAFRQAVDLGADWIELDVQLAADLQIVVVHDETLLRLAGRPERVGDLATAELARIHVLADRYPPTDETIIPALRDVLEGVGRLIPLYIEMKSNGWGRAEPRNRRLVRDCLDLVPSDSPHLLASFDPDLVRAVLEEGRRAVYILDEPRHLEDLHEDELLSLHAVSVRHDRLDMELQEQLRTLGLPLWMWTVDGEDAVRRAWDRGAAGICTNDVPGTRETLREGHA